MPDNNIAASALEVHANAWCGEEARGTLGPDSIGWGVRPDLPRAVRTLAPKPLYLADWSDPRVGWGLIVPDRDDVLATDKARGKYLPDALRELVHSRNDAPVFHYRVDLKEGRLRRYAPDGTYTEPSLRGKRGIGADAVPYYLLIAASPFQIPWSFQYRLQTEAFIGRLDLDDDARDRYIECLLADWPACAKSRAKPLVWAADHGHPDITRLMRKVIAEPLFERFKKDRDFVTACFYTDTEASHDDLIEALLQRDPAFVMTSSHGATFPLSDPDTMRAQLGLPIDHARNTLSLSALSAWNPNGAIWYAHACCSAGADARSQFTGLVNETSTLGRVLDGITKVGACQAPLPRALLGAPNPARAFIGHVEPTFDWTLRDPLTGQNNAQPILDALYDQLHLNSSPPVGLAMNSYFRAVAGLLQDHVEANDAINAHEPGAPERARRARLIACDKLAMVILGDPTVHLA